MSSEVEKINKNNSVVSLIDADSTETLKRHITEKIPLALIDPKPLTLALFANFIHDNSTEYHVILFNQLDELIDYNKDGQNAIKIIVFNIGAERVANGCGNSIIPIIKNQYPLIPLVLIADCEEPCCYIQAINMGASAYITTSLVPAVVIAALKLVLAGGIFSPVQALFSDINQHQQSTNGRRTTDNVESDAFPDTIFFTPRQLEVLEHVKLGEPNKVIAYKLGMQECTVKVHMRDIMKKLHATNRTQLVYNAERIKAELDTK